MTNDSRRLSVFDVSGEKRGDKQYFDILWASLKSTETQQLFWKLLEKIPLNGFNYRDLFVTQIMTRLRAQNMENNIGIFLIDLYNTQFDQNQIDDYPNQYMNENGNIFYMMLNDGYNCYTEYIKRTKGG